MADPIELNSARYRQPQGPALSPEVWDNVLPAPGNYAGAPKASDAATLAIEHGDRSCPGSSMPSQPWEPINPQPGKRGALRR